MPQLGAEPQGAAGGRKRGSHDLELESKKRARTLPLVAAALSRRCLEADASAPGVQVLVVCSASELYAKRRELDELARGVPHLRTAQVCGTMPISRSREMLRHRRPHVLLGTSGRLLELAREGHLRPDHVKRVVFVDGSEQATAGGELIQALAAKSACEHADLPDAEAPPAQPDVTDARLCAAAELELRAPSPALRARPRYFARVEETGKVEKLCSLLDSVEFVQLVIFAQLPGTAHSLSRRLSEDGHSCTVVHSGLAQEDLDSKLRRFATFETRVLISAGPRDLRGLAGRLSGVVYYDLADGSDSLPHLAAWGASDDCWTVSFVRREEEEVALKEAHAWPGHAGLIHCGFI